MRNMHYGNFPLTFFYFLLFCILHTSKAESATWKPLRKALRLFWCHLSWHALQTLLPGCFPDDCVHTLHTGWISLQAYCSFCPGSDVIWWRAAKMCSRLFIRSHCWHCIYSSSVLMVYGPDLAKGLKHSPDSLMTSQLMQLCWLRTHWPTGDSLWPLNLSWKQPYSSQ